MQAKARLTSEDKELDYGYRATIQMPPRTGHCMALDMYFSAAMAVRGGI